MTSKRLVRPIFLLVYLVSSLGAQLGCEEQLEDQTSCTQMSIPVVLEEGATQTFQLKGELCWTGELKSKTTQVLLHGAGYGPIYWDFTYKPETYSYVRAALNRGYAVFNFARLGVEKSDIPPATELTIERDAFIVHQIIEALRAYGQEAQQPLGDIITVGHSMGSIITMVHGIEYPDDIAGMILTGFIHHVNGDYVRANIASQVKAEEDPRFEDRDLGEGYISSSPETRAAFYEARQAEQEVIDRDYETREPVSLTEIFGIQKYYGEGAERLTRPIFQVIGDQDFIGCGTSLADVTLECTQVDVVIAQERSRFPAETCLETEVIPDAGHVLNLQRQAPTIYQKMHDWLDRRIGVDAETEPTEPCVP